jgi:Protein of unknown function (DUF1566)
VPQTGQTTSFASGDDGDIQAGVPFPTPRFIDNRDGTVMDQLTGLIWLKNANCFGALLWVDALKAANTLASGKCGLLDGSVAGNWRVPNIKELQSLIDYGFVDPTHPRPALSNAAGTGPWTEGDAFSGVQGVEGWTTSIYWSSTSPSIQQLGQYDVWRVVLDNGRTDQFNFDASFVWPVRGGK